MNVCRFSSPYVRFAPIDPVVAINWPIWNTGFKARGDRLWTGSNVGTLPQYECE